jgi:hypothetical protein
VGWRQVREGGVDVGSTWDGGRGWRQVREEGVEVGGLEVGGVEGGREGERNGKCGGNGEWRGDNEFCTLN